MKKNRFFYILTFISGTILVISLILGFYISNEINKTSESLNLKNNNENYDYHIMMLLDKSYQVYSEEFETGVIEASKKYSIATEIIKIGGKNYLEEILDRLDMAMYAKVDGIVLHAYNDERIMEKIEQANDMGIPVVTLNEDLPQSPRITYVGVSKYNIGLEVGKTIANATDGHGKIAVIQRRSFADSIESEAITKMDLLILGIEDVFENYKDLNLEKVSYTEEGVLSAETVATEILDENPDINGIYCTDGQSTLGIVQVLIDKNLVKNIMLIGFGDDEEILNYIEKGKIIEATIITDSKYIGSNAVRAIYEYKTTELVKSHINTPLQIVDENNVKAYRKEKGESYEEND